MRRKFLNSVILGLTIAIASLFFFFNGYKSATLYSDALGYYMYLPPTLIYHNHKALNNLPQDRGISSFIFANLNTMNEQQTPKGYTLNQYTYGVDFMELPFFLVADMYEKVTGKYANGFSQSYVALLKISSLVYGILGLILVYKILKNYFTDTQALLTTCALFAGTNLFWFMLYQAGMSHVPLFFLYGLLIYLSIKMHREPKLYLFAAAGLAAGMITIIRPTDILCLIIPLFYNIYDKETLLEKVRFIKQNLKGIVLFAAVFFLPFIPQMIYWKIVSGSYLYYSYGHQSFDWRHPKIIEGLFYFSNGWLPYSPVMIFSLAGMFLFSTVKRWFVSLWLLLPLYIYVIYSWYCYNYINGLGSRPMIHMYPLLAIPFAAEVQFIGKKQIVFKWLFGIVCLFFIALNISYCMQQSKEIISSEESNWEFQRSMLFRMHLGYNDLVARDVAEPQPAEKKIKRICTLACKTFDDSTSDHLIKDTTGASRYVYRMGEEEYGDVVMVKYSRAQFGEAKWFKCSGKFMYTQAPDYFKHLLVLDIPNKLWKSCKIENKINGGDSSFYKMNDVKLEYSQVNKWGYVYYYVRVPAGLQDGDDIKLFVWNIGKRPLYMDDICLELYK